MDNWQEQYIKRVYRTFVEGILTTHRCLVMGKAGSGKTTMVCKVVSELMDMNVFKNVTVCSTNNSNKDVMWRMFDENKRSSIVCNTIYKIILPVRIRTAVVRICSASKTLEEAKNLLHGNKTVMQILAEGAHERVPIQDTSVLVIDEAFLMNPVSYYILEYISRNFLNRGRFSDRAFSVEYSIDVGDPCQLSSPGEQGCLELCKRYLSSRDSFYCYMSENFRQSADKVFAGILDRMANGICHREDVDTLNKQVDDSVMYNPKKQVDVTRVCMSKQQLRRFKLELDSMQGRKCGKVRVTYEQSTASDYSKGVRERWRADVADRCSSVIEGDEVVVTESDVSGCCLYYKGSHAKILSVQSQTVTVHLHKENRDVCVREHNVYVNKQGVELYELQPDTVYMKCSFIPVSVKMVRLVDSVQGDTLDGICIDPTAASGASQTDRVRLFVGLSRVRELRNVTLHSPIQDWYVRDSDTERIEQRKLLTTPVIYTTV